MGVKFRERKLAKEFTKYYLDIIHNGERTYEFLDVKIESKDSTSLKKEKREIANLIRSNRELEIITGDSNYIPKHLKRINFHEFAQSFIDAYNKKDVRMINATYKKFQKFINNDKLKLSEVSPFIMNGFKDYLNEEAGLKGESPHNYFTRFKKILKDAELKGLIKKIHQMVSALKEVVHLMN